MPADNPLFGSRDHLSYRSYHYPVKHVIDGDLCKQYNTLDHIDYSYLTTTRHQGIARSKYHYAFAPLDGCLP